MRWAIVALLMLGVCLMLGCDSNDPSTVAEDPPVAEPVTSGPPSEDYSLVWSDEFTGTLLDLTKWRHRLQGPRFCAINTKEAVTLDGKGHLVITAKRVGDEIWTGMIGTQDTFLATYGYFECRVLMQPARGCRSAFWLTSPLMGNTDNNPAVNGAELGIYTCSRPDADWVNQYVHWNGWGADSHQVSFGPCSVSSVAGEYHTYGLEWTDGGYVYYIDGQVSGRTSQGLSRTDQYIVLNVDVSEEDAPIAMSSHLFRDSVTFDYVRVYQKT